MVGLLCFCSALRGGAPTSRLWILGAGIRYSSVDVPAPALLRAVVTEVVVSLGRGTAHVRVHVDAERLLPHEVEVMVSNSS